MRKRETAKDTKTDREEEQPRMKHGFTQPAAAGTKEFEQELTEETERKI